MIELLLIGSLLMPADNGWALDPQLLFDDGPCSVDMIEALDTLKEVRDVLGPKSTDAVMHHSVYVTPSQMMRNEAAAIDRKDAVIDRLRKLIEDLECVLDGSEDGEG